jgi:ribosome maturation protein SDO1
LDESRYSVDPFKRLEEQVKDAIDKLKPMIPLSFESVRLAFRVPGSAYGSVSRILRPYQQKEQWLENGTWAAVIECPAGMKPDLIGQVMRQSSESEVKEL